MLPAIRLLLPILLLFATLAALAAQPATTTAPATGAISPREVFTRLSEAMEAGDTSTIRSLIHVADPQEAKLADAMVELVSANVRLRQAALSAFGPQGARPLVGDPAAAAAKTAASARMEEVVERDRATLLPVDATQEPVFLVRVDGQWKVDMARAAQAYKVEAGGLEALVAEMMLRAKVISAAAADIKARKFSSADEAALALEGRMKLATMPATTRSSP